MDDKAPLEGRELEYTAGGGVVTEGNDWLAIARQAHDDSTDYLKANYKAQIEKNIDNFNSKHPVGSKYHTKEYLARSRLFRPQTRKMVRKNEAALASALFSADDVVVVEAEDVDDPQKRRDALYWHEVLNYRLNKTIPWFPITVGAYQEAQVKGVVVSKQYWQYDKVVIENIATNPMTGEPLIDDETGEYIVYPEEKIKKNEPIIRLVEFNNFRLDPAADWVDPINSSPYLIEKMPMYLIDVMAKMTNRDTKTGEPEWKPLSRKDVLRYGKDEDSRKDTTRQAQNKGRDTEADHSNSDFEIVWVHENIVRDEHGVDWVYYTLSTKKLLSDPVEICEVYQHGIRPYVRGVAVIEPHKVYPTAPVELSEQLQAESNHNINMRLDLAAHSMNQRKFVHRDSNTDLDALMYQPIGGIVLTDDPESIRPEQTPQVPSSFFAEQNRLDADFDDIGGVFSTSSVQGSRQLGETVGGMELMSQNASQGSEYIIRTFVETWVEPVLRQLVLLEQSFEDDPKIKAIAQKKMQKREKKNNQAGPEQMQAEVEVPDFTPLEEPQAIDVRVNVGFGNTNPDQRIKSAITGAQALGSLVPWTVSKIDVEAMAGAIFGPLGHKSGRQFYTDFEPPQANPMAELEMRKQELEEAKLKNEFEFNKAKLMMEKEQFQVKMEVEREIKMMTLAVQENLKLKELYAKLGIEQNKVEAGDRKAGVENLTRIAEIERKQDELAFKERTGRQGI